MLILCYISGFAASLYYDVVWLVWFFCLLETYSNFFVTLYAFAQRAVMSPVGLLVNFILRGFLLGIALTFDAHWVALAALFGSIIVLCFYLLSMTLKFSTESE